MAAADLDFALVEFRDRTKQIREIMALVEAAGRTPTALTTPRAGIDLSQVSVSTSNTANSMALIFLASAFEEFVREEAIQCGNYLMDKYPAMPAGNKNMIRDSYWVVSRDRLKFMKSILVSSAPDPARIGKVGALLGSLKSFVVDDDASRLDSQTFAHHSNNFRPAIVVEIFRRFAVKDLPGQLGENVRLKSYFGVSTKAQCSQMLASKWDEFYDRRNETVHSLGGASGLAVDAVSSYVEFMELIAEALKGVLVKTLASWP